MDRDEILEALGLAGLLDVDVGDEDADEPAQENASNDSDTDDNGEEDGDAESEPGDTAQEEQSDTGDTDTPASDELEDQIADLRHQLTQVNDRIETNEGAIKSLESTQEAIEEEIDTLDEHDAQLLSVYDRLTPGVNPFADDWEADHEFANDDDDSPYNVVSPPESEDSDTQDDEDDEAVSIDDLKDDYTEDDEEPEEPEPEPEPEDNNRPSPSERTVPDAPEPDPEPVQQTSAPVEHSVVGSTDAYLTHLTPAYASEVLMMEWMTMLTETAGSAGALKTLDYYERIDWISKPVKLQLEDILSGAEISGESSDEIREPGDLSTEEHRESFSYLIKLEQVSDEATV